MLLLFHFKCCPISCKWPTKVDIANMPFFVKVQDNKLNFFFNKKYKWDKIRSDKGTVIYYMCWWNLLKLCRVKDVHTWRIRGRVAIGIRFSLGSRLRYGISSRLLENYFKVLLEIDCMVYVVEIDTMLSILYFLAAWYRWTVPRSFRREKLLCAFKITGMSRSRGSNGWNQCICGLLHYFQWLSPWWVLHLSFWQCKLMFIYK